MAKPQYTVLRFAVWYLGEVLAVFRFREQAEAFLGDEGETGGFQITTAHVPVQAVEKLP